MRGRSEIVFAGVVGIASAFYILKPMIDQSIARQEAEKAAKAKESLAPSNQAKPDYPQS